MESALKAAFAAALFAVAGTAQAATLNFAPEDPSGIPLSSLSNSDVDLSSTTNLQATLTLEPSFSFAGVSLFEPTSFTFAFSRPVEQMSLVFTQSERYDNIIDVETLPAFSVLLTGAESPPQGQEDAFSALPLDGPVSWNVSNQGTFTMAIFSFQMGSALRANPDPAEPNPDFDEYFPVGLGLQSLSYEFATPVPEPETCALLLAGFGLIAWIARRKHRQ